MRNFSLSSHDKIKQNLRLKVSPGRISLGNFNVSENRKTSGKGSHSLSQEEIKNKPETTMKVTSLNCVS